MPFHQMEVDEILVAIFEQERSLFLDNLSDEEKEFAQVIIDHLNDELKEIGYEVKIH